MRLLREGGAMMSRRLAVMCAYKVALTETVKAVIVYYESEARGYVCI